MLSVAAVATLLLTFFNVDDVRANVAAAPRFRNGVRAAATPPCPHRAYVAIGDAFAAGVDAGDVLPDCASVNGPRCTPSDCARTKGSYPYQFFTANPRFPFTYSSCATANTSNIISTQINGTTTEGGPWPPSSEVDLVTISIGANDVGVFTNAMSDCMAQAQGKGCACNSTLQAGRDVISNDLPGRLDTVFSSVQSKVVTNATVLVMGYPRLWIAPNATMTAACSNSAMASVDDQTKIGMDAVVDGLNSALQTAAEKYGFEFVDVSSAFAGHQMCDSQSWFQYSMVNGTGTQYVHPTSDGQTAMRGVFKDAVCGY